MALYRVRVKEAERGETVEIPDSARDVEIEYYEDVIEQPGIGTDDEIVEYVQVKYLEKTTESVI